MDNYTARNKKWLDERFKACDESSIYLAHQPIYGFGDDHSEPGIFERYVRTYQILRYLSRLEINSLLDVGGGEGYHAFLAKKLLGLEIKMADLSEEACKRSKEIFSISSVAADVQKLPFRDDEFDAVLCSETLEHVTSYKKALDELLRVSRRVLLITVPLSSRKKIEKNIKDKVPHGHINAFDINSFNYLENRGYRIISKRILSIFTLLVGRVLERRYIEDINQKLDLPKVVVGGYKMISPLLNFIFRPHTFYYLMKLDDLACRIGLFSSGALFIITKKRFGYSQKLREIVTVFDVIRFKVPYHHLK